MVEGVYVYCPKCGSIGMGLIRDGKFVEENCSFCGHEKYMTKYFVKDLPKGVGEQIHNQIFIEYVKDNPLYDEDAVRNREEDIEKMYAKETSKMLQQQRNNILKCPKCGSTAVTTGARGYSLLTGFLGSGSTVNRCGKCGHTWKPRG